MKNHPSSNSSVDVVIDTTPDATSLGGPTISIEKIFFFSVSEWGFTAFICWLLVHCKYRGVFFNEFSSLGDWGRGGRKREEEGGGGRRKGRG
jgi:hypothetical protein